MGIRSSGGLVDEVSELEGNSDQQLCGGSWDPARRHCGNLGMLFQ